ncbi:MAG: hypothetical protein ACRDWG_07725 [Actinomycetes bacterium]
MGENTELGIDADEADVEELAQLIRQRRQQLIDRPLDRHAGR